MGYLRRHIRHLVSVERREGVVSASSERSTHAVGQGDAEAATARAAVRRSPGT